MGKRVKHTIYDKTAFQSYSLSPVLPISQTPYQRIKSHFTYTFKILVRQIPINAKILIVKWL